MPFSTKKSIPFLLLFIIFHSCQNAEKQRQTPNDETIKKELLETKSEKTTDFNENNNAYFGDLHVHTSWSFDAFIYNVRTTPDDAYNYGKGEAIDHISGKKVQLNRPLDFMAVTDHSEYMGIMKQMIDSESPLFNLPISENIRSKDRATSLRAFGIIGTSMARNEPIEQLAQKDIMKNTWEKLVATANKHNQPGKFTTFPAYEWTSSPSETNASPTFARNLHRNVIYKGEKVSEIPFSSFDSQDPENLWNWMEKERNNGIDLLAIPHNANMSDGLMFDSKRFDGTDLDEKYAQSRALNEPIQEVTQIKGTSMAHPDLAPNDEFADFEIYNYTFATAEPPKSKPDGSYVRQALKNGLKLEQDLGANPFKFGFIGSSDGHNSASPVEEDNYFGKLGNVDATPEVRIGASEEFVRSKYFSAAGLAGVWAKENTRDAIYQSMERKEVFATTGPRIQVRFFAGWNIENNIFDDENWVASAYENAIPMGSDLQSGNNEAAPSFVIWAVKDNEGANLDRIQVVKGWVDENGETQEKIYNVAWSEGRELDANGKLSAVGNTVNVEEVTYTNSIGGVNLQTVWQDLDFDASISAFYYLRVLEIPTPRWSTYDAKKMGIEPMKERSATIQERAWSSPIWYNAK